MIQIHDKLFRPFITKEEIVKHIDIIADKLNDQFKDKTPIIIGVLNGCYIFLIYLTNKLNFECEIQFIKVSSYHKTNSTGTVTKHIGLNQSINNRDIIIVEDIIDTGNTIEFIRNELNQFHPTSVTITTLFFKPGAYQFTKPPDYYLFKIKDIFIVGYGLDYCQLGRNLPDIYQLDNGSEETATIDKKYVDNEPVVKETN